MGIERRPGRGAGRSFAALLACLAGADGCANHDTLQALRMPGNNVVLPAQALNILGQVSYDIGHHYIRPISAKASITRAIDGIASDPASRNPPAQEAIRTARAQLARIAEADLRAGFASLGMLIETLSAMHGGQVMIVYRAIEGMAGGLDPFSFYVRNSPAAAKDHGRDTDEVGALMGQFDGHEELCPIEGGSAARAGLQCGDRIVSIDGHSLADGRYIDVDALLTGPVGSFVEIGVERSSQPYSLSRKLRRERNRIDVTGAARLLGHFAYIRLSPGTADVADHFRAIFHGLRAQASGPLEGLILDLRYDEGGLLEQMGALAGALMPAGSLIVQVRGRDPAHDESYRATQGDMTDGLPIVVIVNGWTSAGGEIVAGALHDNGRATLVGSRTGGAGTIQTVYPFGGLGALQITTGIDVLPSGQPFDHIGITPDIALTPRSGVIAAGDRGMVLPLYDPATMAQDGVVRKAVDLLQAKTLRR